MTRPRYSQKNWVECAAHFPKSFPNLRHSIKEGFGLQLAIAQIPKLTHKAYKFKFLLTIQRVSPGGTPLYKLYRYVPPQRVWFLSCFGLKTGIDFDHYGLKSGVVSKGTTGAYKCICLFNSK